MKNRSPQYSIGIFDSGFGGLHILKHVVKKLPQFDYVYLGDTARTPYGTRSKDIIHKFTHQAIEFLITQNCSLIIVACNTASSDALRKIQQEKLRGNCKNKRVLGVLIPAVEESVTLTKNKRVGVIATEATVASGAFIRELKKLDPSIKVFQKACPLLVPLVEAGEHRSKAAKLILESYLLPFIKKTSIDTLILGCTHYGILEKSIRELIGPRIQIVSEAKIVPLKLSNYLERHPEIKNGLGKNNSIQFYSTDLTERFRKLGRTFFGTDIHVKKILLQ